VAVRRVAHAVVVRLALPAARDAIGARLVAAQRLEARHAVPARLPLVRTRRADLDAAALVLAVRPRLADLAGVRAALPLVLAALLAAARCVADLRAGAVVARRARGPFRRRAREDTRAHVVHLELLVRGDRPQAVDVLRLVDAVLGLHRRVLSPRLEGGVR